MQKIEKHKDGDLQSESSELITKYLNSKTRKRVGLSNLNHRRKRRYVIEERNYEKIIINKVTIFLPSNLQPYPTQKLMMVKMLNALNNKLNALIESPTGSGKTLALLSSSCAWLLKYKEERILSKQNCPKHGTISTKSNTKTKIESVKKTSLSSDCDDKKFAIKNPKKRLSNVSNDENMDSSVLIVDDNDINISKIKTAFDELNEEFNEDFVQKATTSIETSENFIQKSKLTEINSSDYSSDDTDSEKENNSRVECTCYPRVIIYYGTRTHKQITQVIKEYSRLPFGVNDNLRHTILASREHSCVNPIARSKPDITAHCKELLSNDGVGCTFRNEMRRYEKNPYYLRQFNEENGGNRVWDMEELVQALAESRPAICPYFASTRTFTIDADIVFCPFNYLIDPIIRRSSDVHLKNSIVILDEAHNVEDICREAASFDLQEKELIFCLENLTEKEAIVSKYLRKIEKSVVQNDKNSFINVGLINEDNDLNLFKVDNQISLQDLEIIYKDFYEALLVLLKFAQLLYDWIKIWALKTMKIAKQKTDGSYVYTYNWEELLSSLKNDDLTKNLLVKFESEQYKQLTTCWLLVSNKEKSTLDDNKDSSRSKDGPRSDTIPDIFRPAQSSFVTLEKFITFLQYFSVTENQMFYKCNVTIERLNIQNTQFQTQHKRGRFLGLNLKTQKYVTQSNESEWLSSNTFSSKYDPIKPNFNVIINLWCMLPSVSFMDAFKNCHSLILASGTLCPTETLKTELGLAFKSEMEGTQVISRERIFANVLSAGPNGFRLNATFKNISSGTEFMSELARAIVATCLIVPKGVLCFVSSYNVLNYLKDAFETHNLITPLKAKKAIFEEPRRSADLQSTLNAYEEAIKNPRRYGPTCDGALMLAVFRGKVSEGIDFADDKARCVICVGIPYPNATNELVIQKKRFNDNYAKSAKVLGGDEWYTTQAYRALNQALGRCLRHCGDWGALVLIDERFEAKANPRCADSKKISRWVRENLVVYKDFEKFTTALSEFVQKMKILHGENDENDSNFSVEKNEIKPLITIL